MSTSDRSESKKLPFMHCPNSTSLWLIVNILATFSFFVSICTALRLATHVTFDDHFVLEMKGVKNSSFYLSFQKEQTRKKIHMVQRE